MKLSALLTEGQILQGLAAQDKGELIARLADLLVAQGRLPAPLRGPAVEALMARERIASTGMEHGIAIPHASIDGLDAPLAVLGLSPDGVPFQSADGKPARILVLLAIPRQQVADHTRTLAGIARLLQYEEFRDALLRARSPREVLQVVRDEEQREGT
jgi:mannitol/fructose-specific phosphotransferase system IIA component (Ntr-type)